MNLDNNPDIPPEDVPPTHHHHAYTSYERMILANVSMFHKNFNAHDFDKNGQLVVDDICVHSNGTELRGREAFVSRIKRYLVPFPDLTINDLMTIVDGNRAAIRYVMIGTHTGDLATPEGVIGATQRKIAVDGSEWFTFDMDGKLIDLVTIVRNDQLMMQLRGA
jgi:predicted ester cyclase